MKRPIHGFVPAVVTPFNDRGEIQMDLFEGVLRWCLDIGADGICIAGDNGESWTLPAEERRALLETARRTLDGRVPVILGASAPTSKQSIKYAEVAAESGADAILLMPQTYVLKATRAELTAHFSSVASRSPTLSCSSASITKCEEA